MAVKTGIFARQAFVAGRWAGQVQLDIAGGKITAVTENAEAQPRRCAGGHVVAGTCPTCIPTVSSALWRV